MSPVKEKGSIFNHEAAHGGGPEMNEKVPAMLGPSTKRYFRVDEVARYFSVSDRTIYRLIDMGDLKVVRLRDCIRISAEEIRSLEERQREDF